MSQLQAVVSVLKPQAVVPVWIQVVVQEEILQAVGMGSG